MKKRKVQIFAIGLLCLSVGLSLSGCRKKAAEEAGNQEVGTAAESSVKETEKEKETETEREEVSKPEEDWITPFPVEEQERFERPDYEAEDAGDWDHTVFLAADIHYLSKELTDRGEGFMYSVEHGDGKVTHYIDEITDAFAAAVIEKKPDVLLLCGDLTLDGERKSHMELAQKLYQIEDSGIPVLVVPGNHDINNPHAAEFRGIERIPAEYTTPEEFRRIYRDFGYDDEFCQDPNSLSYVYDLDPSTRFLMIDSCMYEPRARVGGSVSEETYEWITEQLQDAWNNGMVVVPVAHHNLLDESEIYVEDCSIEHGEQLADILNEWDVSMFFSGHLHVQHAKRSDENKGIWEMVTSSLATPACQYGVLNFDSNGSFAYHTNVVDVQSWAIHTGSRNNDLLGFDAFKEPFLRRVFYNQAYDELKKNTELSEGKRVKMAKLYSEANYHYYQGDAYLVRERLRNDPSYELWQTEGGNSPLIEYLTYILEDALMDYNHVTDP